MAKKIKVEGNPSLERDTNTTAIINTNNNAYLTRRNQIKNTENKRKLDEQRTQDIDKLKNDVTEIKKILQQIIGGQ